MTAPQAPRVLALAPDSLARLMPMYLAIAPTGEITDVGPTMAKLLPSQSMIGRAFEAVFELRRPNETASYAALQMRGGRRLHLVLRQGDGAVLRGLATPMADPAQGMLINLSIGIGVVKALGQYALTHADFAPTDLTVELLYLVEAQSAVMAESRNLNLRLQGAKTTAEEQALTDTLTGLRNRRALDLTLGALTRHGTAFGLMHIDLDFFKQVNDSLGHAAGDHVLREVAKVLLGETRSSDMVARVGGDEFVIIMPGLFDPARLGQIARRIIDQLTLPTDFEGAVCRISASIGVTVSTFYDQPDADRMLSDADDALYASKRAGRGQAQFFDPPDTGRLSA